MMTNNKNLELGNILDEAKKISDDSRVHKLLEELIDFEKGFPGWYKEEIRALIAKNLENNK